MSRIQKRVPYRRACACGGFEVPTLAAITHRQAHLFITGRTMEDVEDVETRKTEKTGEKLKLGKQKC
jgi:3-keto-L-gulonate-6-phosphate decarboxylase